MCSTAQYVLANTLPRLHVSWKEWTRNTLNKRMNVEEQFDALRKEFFLSFILRSNGEMQVPSFKEHNGIWQP